MKILKKILRVIEIIVVIICIFIGTVIVTQRVSNNKSAFFGFRVFKVETGSMIPKYQIGDVLLVRERAFDKIKEGDDLAYRAAYGVMKGNIITHKVIKVIEDEEERAVITQGIANNTPDGKIFESQAIGVVYYRLPILSLICKGINNIYIFYFLIIVPLTVYIFFNLIKANRHQYEKVEKKKATK